MHIAKMILTIAFAASFIAFTQPTDSFAASKKPAAQAASWDGTWAGKWSGKSSGKVTIKNNKVTSYYFQGRAQKVGGTKVSGKTIRFGSGYSVTMTFTGADTANAVWKGDGTAQASMSRR
ncbi:hypothetical protein [Sinorhizobium sp. BG8]|uniref:hypothetical protein n=1 Tax=Sinorhizobium sp. BG8 TaxID=2613773 RepID=UPI00193DCEAE|nr:hypothetical protein [Sinorhizobium sp. BG8]QRM54427.1 hypothetical protein F3Y30_07620 [Sinorhizobium sp. BG8]